MRTTYDLTTGPRKGTFQLHLEPASILLGVHEAGIKTAPVPGTLTGGTVRRMITAAQARRLVATFGKRVTYYGQPLP